MANNHLAISQTQWCMMGRAWKWQAIMVGKKSLKPIMVYSAWWYGCGLSQKSTNRAPCHLNRRSLVRELTVSEFGYQAPLQPSQDMCGSKQGAPYVFRSQSEENNCLHSVLLPESDSRWLVAPQIVEQSYAHGVWSAQLPSPQIFSAQEPWCALASFEALLPCHNGAPMLFCIFAGGASDQRLPVLPNHHEFCSGVPPFNNMTLCGPWFTP